MGERRGQFLLLHTGIDLGLYRFLFYEMWLFGIKVVITMNSGYPQFARQIELL